MNPSISLTILFVAVSIIVIVVELEFVIYTRLPEIVAVVGSLNESCVIFATNCSFIKSYTYTLSYGIVSHNVIIGDVIP